LKQRRTAVDGLVLASEKAPKVEAEQKIQKACDKSWTAKHEKESKFQHDKVASRKVEAYRDGMLLNHEVDVALQVACDFKTAAEKKRKTEREKLAAKNMTRLKPEPPVKSDMEGWKVYVESHCASNELDKHLKQHKLSIVTDRGDAVLIIASHPSDPGQRSSWWASFLGMYIASPDFVVKNT
jgi:hypothetical protein